MQSALRSNGVGHSVQLDVKNDDPGNNPERAYLRMELLDWIGETVVEANRDLAVLIPVFEGFAPIWSKSSDVDQMSFNGVIGLIPTMHIKEVKPC